jgi:hypothetical protein
VKEGDNHTKWIKEWANGVRELFSFDEERRKKANGNDVRFGRNGKEIKIRKGCVGKNEIFCTRLSPAMCSQ